MMTCEGYDFSFDPSKCETCEGNCCIGESGYIWCTPGEIDAIATFLKLKRDMFLQQYTQKVKYRYSLKEREVDGSYHCIFFDEKRRGCSIYPVRPTQCRTFPFWEHYKTHKDEVIKECPGIII